MNDEINHLFSPKTIREQAFKIFHRVKQGEGYFNYHEDRWPDITSHVIQTIKENYPSLDIPFHARYVHFKAGGHDRLATKSHFFQTLDEREKARTLVELVITSVLLDAGAGAQWKYVEKETNESYSRSEGLGVVSFHIFFSGSYSKEGKAQATAKGLQSFSLEKLREEFQVSEENPLIGEMGRVKLIQKLGEVVEKNSDFFPDGRLGGLVDFFLKEYGKELPAEELLKTLLLPLGPIWPGRLEKEGVNLGDVWEYSPLGELVPFHKLSQWLSYSLIEPLEEAGIRVTEMEKLTGLPEYRNGGLFVDGGLISLKNEADYSKAWKPESELIIEWRALTICLLDECAQRVRKEMSLSESDFPLVKVLEGGTWWAGRRLAANKRADSSPPIKIESDGTVF